jgi:hypothetical protein
MCTGTVYFNSVLTWERVLSASSGEMDAALPSVVLHTFVPWEQQARRHQ